MSLWSQESSTQILNFLPQTSFPWFHQSCNSSCFMISESNSHWWFGKLCQQKKKKQEKKHFGTHSEDHPIPTLTISSHPWLQQFLLTFVSCYFLVWREPLQCLRDVWGRGRISGSYNSNTKRSKGENKRRQQILLSTELSLQVPFIYGQFIGRRESDVLSFFNVKKSELVFATKHCHPTLAVLSFYFFFWSNFCAIKVKQLNQTFKLVKGIHLSGWNHFDLKRRRKKQNVKIQTSDRTLWFYLRPFVFKKKKEKKPNIPNAMKYNGLHLLVSFFFFFCHLQKKEWETLFFWKCPETNKIGESLKFSCKRKKRSKRKQQY